MAADGSTDDRQLRARSRHLSASLKAVVSEPIPCFHGNLMPGGEH